MLAACAGITLPDSVTKILPGSSVSPSSPIEPLQAAPSPLWQSQAERFITWAEEQLWSVNGDMARDYLQGRGLHLDTLRVWRLGWNPRFWQIPAARWGLVDTRSIWLHPGIVLPHISALGDIWSVKIRVFDGGVPVVAAGKKYRGPRGARGQGMLYGESHLRRLPVLTLVEGEFDALLTWQEAGDLCDIGTLGGAGKRIHPLALTILAQYPTTLAILDDDAAADKGRAYLQQFPRILTAYPPDHDLTDYWRHGGDLRAWIKEQIAHCQMRM